MAFRLTRKAEDDLTRLYLSGVRDFGFDRAEAYISELTGKFALLAENPAMARLREDITPPVRIHPHRAHIVVFLEDEAGILIIRIRHGREDWLRTDA